MKTNALDNCLRILGYWKNDDETIIGELASQDTDFFELYVEPFKRELALNLLTKSSSQEKQDIIRFYIDVLNNGIIVPKDYSDIEPVNPETDALFYPIWYSDQDETDSSGVAEVRAHYIFSKLFEVIQDYCILYHLPFLEICRDLSFNIDTINLAPTKDREELEDLYARETIQKPSEFPEIKPIFVPESISDLYEILRDFFSPEDQVELLWLLQNGGNTSKPLIFLDSGNRLADAFKQLYNCDIIRGCQKKELEEWVLKNFQFRKKDKIVNYTLRYLNDIISTNKDKCQRPVLDVKQEKSTGKFLITKI